MENTYSAGKGKYQKELNKLHATYTSLTALHATDSARANSALKNLFVVGENIIDTTMTGIIQPAWESLDGIGGVIKTVIARREYKF